MVQCLCRSDLAVDLEAPKGNAMERNGRWDEQSHVVSIFRTLCETQTFFALCPLEVCQVPRVRDMSDVAADEDCHGAGVAYFSNFKTPGGLRCSSALPLHEVRHQRNNLHIRCNTQVGIHYR